MNQYQNNDPNDHTDPEQRQVPGQVPAQDYGQAPSQVPAQDYGQEQRQVQEPVQYEDVDDRPRFAEVIDHQAHHPTFTGSTLADSEGREVGTIDDVVFDTDSTEPTWLVVNPGFLRAERFVPVQGAAWVDQDTVAVPYDHDTVTSAPKAGKDHVVDREVRAELISHYHLAGV